MIEIISLTKKFGKFAAIENINLKIEKGEILSFLGPNGAGKTTTLKIIAGLLKPTYGFVKICGFDVFKEPVEAKKRMGFVPDRPFLYSKLTAREFLKFIGNIYALNGNILEEKCEELFEIFDLQGWEDELIEGFSHGMKQRLVMAGSLLHNPEVIIIDEPVVGLDPKGAKLLKEILKIKAKEGKAIFMSTHILEIAEEISTRIAIINNGKIIAVGTKDEIKNKFLIKEAKLEDIFLKLTGGEKYREILEALKI